jgi:hypothetical protein
MPSMTRTGVLQVLSLKQNFPTCTHTPAAYPCYTAFPTADPLHLPPPPVPPPPTYSIPHTNCPPCCLLEGLTRVPSPITTAVDLQTASTLDILLATLPEPPNSVTHIVCSPRVCGVHSDIKSSITIGHDTSLVNKMVDGGSNVCVTGNLGNLLDVVDIELITILVALEGAPATYNDCITKRGLLPLSLSDGSLYYQPCFYCANMVKTIISPAAVLASSDVLFSWSQEGFKDPTLPGSLQFTSHYGLLSKFFPLQCRVGLYYCNTDAYTVDSDPVRVLCNRTIACHPNPKFQPTSKACQVESELWALRFGSPGEHQLDVLPSHVEGTPSRFEYHPFRNIDFKEQAYIQKQPANKSAERIPCCGSKFFMDFGFLWASLEDYKQPNKAVDWIVVSYNGFCAYLLIVSSASRQTWTFLTASKEPPPSNPTSVSEEVWPQQRHHSDRPRGGTCSEQ